MSGVVIHNDANRIKKTRLYTIWCNMKARCLNPNTPNYHRYGGRGINVCDEWSDYINFKKWALQNKYNNCLTIDRKNNNEGYYPTNCQWITNKENVIKGNASKRTLTFKDAVQIRSSNLMQVELASIYNVAIIVIWKIKNNKTYMVDYSC